MKVNIFGYMLTIVVQMYNTYLRITVLQQKVSVVKSKLTETIIEQRVLAAKGSTLTLIYYYLIFVKLKINIIIVN